MSTCRWLPVGLLIVTAAFAATTVDAAADTTTAKTPIHRDDVSTPATGHARPAGSPGTTLIFLGLLLGGAIIVRRVVQQRGKAPHRRKQQETITLLGHQQIDRELSVRLLQVGPRVLIVGSSPQGLATLTEITDPEEIAQLTGATPTSAETSSPFANGMPIARHASNPTVTRSSFNTSAGSGRGDESSAQAARSQGLVASSTTVQGAIETTPPLPPVRDRASSSSHISSKVGR